MLSPKAKRNLSRIIPFGLAWFIYSTVYSLLEKGLLGDLTYYPSTGNPYSFPRTILITPIIALITGLGIGTIEVFYVNRLFARRTFAQKIIYKTLSYLTLICFFLLALGVLYNTIELQTSPLNELVWRNVSLFFLSYAFWSVVIYICSIIAFSLFFNEVSENLGHGVLTNFLTGKYHKPTEEERIFMFLDMKSSTTLAEKLGHVHYFEMLKEYYADLSDPIIDYAGEIYQYVGDEIVVSWTLPSGLHRNNCLRCFFAMKRALQQQSKKYYDRFGVLPQFKAGFHSGKVTTGEIGILKKEIIFTGDVLNTTARIQSLCNMHHVDLLISDHLIQQLSLLAHEIKPLGESELRGRDERIKLFTVDPFNSLWP